MWRGSCALLLSTCLLKASPASSFGSSLFAKPPPASTTSASTTSDAAPRSRADTTPEGSARPSLTNVAAPGWSSFVHGHHRHGWALPAKYDTLEEAIAFARAQGGGDASEGEQEGGGSKGGDGGKEAEKEKQQQPKKPAETANTTPAKAPPSKGPVKAAPAKTAAAKPAAKKSGGSMGGWNWGFKSTAAKAKPAEKAVGSDAKTADGGKEEAEVAAEKEKSAAAAAAVVAAAAKKEAKAAEEEKKAAAAVAAAAKAAEETKAAEVKAEEEAKAAEAMTDAERTAKESEEKASAKAAASAAAANAATAAKAEKLKAKEEEAAQRKASAKAAADAAAAAKAEKVKARNEEVAQKKKAAADAVAAKKAEKTRAKEEEAAQKKAAADAAAAEKAAQIKAKEDEIAEKKAAAQAAVDAAAQAAADEVKARDTEAAKKRAASAEAAAATAEKERRAEAIAALARGDEPKVEKVVKPAEATPAAEDQDKEKSDKKDKAKSDAASATATAAAPAKAPAPAPAKAAAAAPAPAPAKAAAPAAADAPAKSADADGVKDVATDGGSADAPAEGEGEAAEKTPEKKAASKGGWGGFFGTKPKEPSSSLTLSKPETIVVVTGATGRVGQLAVRRILELYPKVLVRAVVNDFAKGSRLLQEEKDTYGIKLEIMSADLSSMRSAARVVEGASAVVFCASGYAQNLSPLQRLANAVRLTINPKSVTDVEGVRDVALALKAAKKIVNKASTTSDDKDKGKDKEEDESEPQPLFPDSPRFVLLSSAAVTRPNWSNEDKALYPLAADVPIVKLNPLNILTVKAEGEKELREVGIPYTVVRPCGLNDDHPRGRPLFSVGDTAAGRICREDVADVLVRCLGTAEATGKTFEVQTLPGLDKVAPSVKAKAGIDQALSNLPTDKDLQDNPNMLNEIRRSTYPVLTQLRPVPLAQANRQQ